MTPRKYFAEVIRMRPQMVPTTRLRWAVTITSFKKPPLRTLQQWWEAPFSRHDVMIGEWRDIDDFLEPTTLGAHTDVPPKPRNRAQHRHVEP